MMLAGWIRRWASLLARRPISWMDQLISSGWSPSSVFWGCRVIGAIPDHRHHAKASMTSDTWRCQPCQERVSLWSSPNSFLVVSKLSSIAQRRPSTETSAWMVVPAGDQVVKNARSPSLILRRISRLRVYRPDCPSHIRTLRDRRVHNRPSSAASRPWPPRRRQPRPGCRIKTMGDLLGRARDGGLAGPGSEWWSDLTPRT